MPNENKPQKLKPEKNPAGMKLLHTLHGHTGIIYGTTWDVLVVAQCIRYI
jgi:hypothetical protein